MTNNNNASSSATVAADIDLSRFTKERLIRMAKVSHAEYQSGLTQPGGPRGDDIEWVSQTDVCRNLWAFAILRNSKTGEAWITEWTPAGEDKPRHTLYVYIPDVGVRKMSIGEHNADAIRAMSDEEIDDRLWTLETRKTQAGYTAYVLARAHRRDVNTAKSNRERVSAMRQQPMPTHDYDEEEEEEEEEEIEEEDMEEEEEEEETPKRSSKRPPVVERARPKASPKAVKAAQVRSSSTKKSVAPGTVELFGNGEYTRGRGRPPKQVTDYLATGHNAFFSRKSGRYLMDDKKTLLYQAK